LYPYLAQSHRPPPTLPPYRSTQAVFRCNPDSNTPQRSPFRHRRRRPQTRTPSQSPPPPAVSVARQLSESAFLRTSKSPTAAHSILEMVTPVVPVSTSTAWV